MTSAQVVVIEHSASWWATLLDGVVGAVVGSVVAVLVAVYVLKKTLTTERDRAREDAALNAAEYLTAATNDLLLALAEAAGKVGAPKLRARAAAAYMSAVTLKAPALVIAPADISTRLTLLSDGIAAYIDVADDAWSKWNQSAPDPVLARRVEQEQRDALEDLSPWIKHVGLSLAAYRSGTELPAQPPTRPVWWR